jgi:phosphopantothenate-cysteine ligase/phosphopantothenoylcysteine decarboxylase/phosphopantothenate--cysteine ligase
MNVLVTAGNTQVPIDRVRCLTNIFTGRTGAQVALRAHERGHAVTLLTSHPDVVADLHGGPLSSARWSVRPYRTFDDLQTLMSGALAAGGPDAVIHSAAVSDYLAGGVYAPAPATRFDPASGRWDGGPPALLDRAAGKVKSDEAELWLRLVRAPKLIDRVRPDWGFGGVLVKFKLEVGVAEARLLEIAERSRRHSSADLMVANTLEGAAGWAYVGSGTHYERVERRELAARVIDAVERLHEERSHG